jgi:hypothetical protein
VVVVGAAAGRALRAYRLALRAFRAWNRHVQDCLDGPAAGTSAGSSSSGSSGGGGGEEASPEAVRLLQCGKPAPAAEAARLRAAVAETWCRVGAARACLAAHRAVLADRPGLQVEAGRLARACG